MNDIRRTILWVVFSVSLVMLWDAWQKHNGQPSMFSPAPAKTEAKQEAITGSVAPAPAALPAAGVPAAIVTTPGSATAPPIASAASAVALSAGSEKITITTDVMRATLDSTGGSLVGLALTKYSDANDAKVPVQLFDQSAQRVYLAQTGLITQQAGATLPNHLTAMRAQPGERSLKPGADELNVVFETTDVSGLSLIKTYTFRRGEYTIGVKHELRNGSTTTLAPQLYLQLARDGNPPAGESSFYYTFTGPAMYTEAQKFTKIEFSDINKGKAVHDKSADNGWIGMVQHYFASAWLVEDKVAREF